MNVEILYLEVFGGQDFKGIKCTSHKKEDQENLQLTSHYKTNVNLLVRVHCKQRKKNVGHIHAYCEKENLTIFIKCTFVARFTKKYK